MRPIPLVLICLVIAVAACGEDTAGPLVLPDPADATTCAELSDMFEEMTADMVGVLGDRTAEEMDDFFDESEVDDIAWLETANEIGMRTGELCDVDAGEFEALACDWLVSISPEGEAGQLFLDNVTPPEGCP